jgi:hypothetical protein
MNCSITTRDIQSQQLATLFPVYGHGAHIVN